MSRYVPPKRPQPYGAIFTAVSTPEPKPKPPPPMPTLTAATIRQFIADLGDDILFGARARYRNDLLGRDRLAEAVIQAEDGSEFWTGDVMTGGAAAIFDRAYISEYLIARLAGANTLDASVRGYEAAKAAYRQATGQVSAPPPAGPVPPGRLAGPIGVSGRDFTVEG